MKWTSVALVVAMLIASAVTALGDWKADIAKRAIGRAAQAGIEAAVKDAIADAAFDAAMSAVVVDQTIAPAAPMPQPTTGIYQPQPPVDGNATIAAQEVIFGPAGEAIETAMTAADVASVIDTVQDAADAAKTIQKVNDVRKAVKKLRR